MATQSHHPGTAPQPPSGGPSGMPASAAPVPPGDPMARSRIAAGAFGIALGWLGVHRFYLGHTAIGIAQIVVTVMTLGLGWIWGIIEGVLILTRDPRFLTDAAGRPLRD